MKRVVMALTLGVVLAAGAGADTLVDIYVNGTKQEFSPAARVREGTTYAPLRAAAEAVGADVKWIESQQLAIICQADACAIIRKQQGIIVSGRLLIPVRLMAEALDAKVSWNGQRKAVMIVTKAADPVVRSVLSRVIHDTEESISGEAAR